MQAPAREKNPRSGELPPRVADPFLERESARYAEPVPSREYILQTLTGRGVPVAEDELERLLGITPDEREAFSRRLAASVLTAKRKVS